MQNAGVWGGDRVYTKEYGCEGVYTEVYTDAKGHTPKCTLVRRGVHRSVHWCEGVYIEVYSGAKGCTACCTRCEGAYTKVYAW